MTPKTQKFMTINGEHVPFTNEKNILSVVRKAGIDLPTLCYYSELSVYGSCRMCMVEDHKGNIITSCSTPPRTGMEIRTNTPRLKQYRKTILKLYLASHCRECTTCPKNTNCKLQDLAIRYGIDEIKFDKTEKAWKNDYKIDDSSQAITRNPNKCIQCGDCVRMCNETQNVGAIDFALRGYELKVCPAFDMPLAETECVNCGQCAAVCPTGALTPRSEVDEVWNALHNPAKTVVVQVAPAVRVAIGELFGMPPGESTRGQMVAALKRLGFDRVYDTSFSADLTVIEEANEFLARKSKGGKLPLFTSCCPGWVKFAEQYFPELLPNLSTCKSPQQMLGALAKELLPAELGVKKEDLVMVSIMPCTAKKFEAKRPEFATDGVPEVDHVLTTQELARMIEEAGLRFTKLQPESFDMPMGFKTGAGVIFGNSGGVSEAVLRYAAEKVTGKKLVNPDFPAVRGENGLRIVEVPVDGITLKLGIVFGLKNARTLAEKARRGKCDLDLIEVMACPGGCIGGAGQPVSRDPDIRRLRTKGLYDVDKNMELHKSQENHYVTECYQKHLGEIGGKHAHRLLHTHYHNRRRIAGEDIALGDGPGEDKLQVKVCTGTNCFLKGSQHILHELLDHVQKEELQERVDLRASFCFEKCEHGPTVSVDGNQIQWCTAAAAKTEINQKLKEKS